jgi:hypothetical protein
MAEVVELQAGGLVLAGEALPSFWGSGRAGPRPARKEETMSESTERSIMSRLTRRSVMKGVAALAGIAAAGAPGVRVFAA